MVISHDLAYVPMFVIELATSAIGALTSLEKGFAVLVFFRGREFWKHHLTVAVGILAVITIAAKSDFNPVFAQLCFVFGLEFSLHVTCDDHFLCHCRSICGVDSFGRSK